MGALARLQTADCANPALDLYTSVNGALTDVYEVSFQIWDKSSGTAVQVYPVTPGAKVPVDVSTSCPAGGRLSQGRYVAVWTPPANEPLGTHQIRWYFKLTGSTPEQTFIEEFEVLSVVVGSGTADHAYVTVQEMRDEGVAASVPDAFLRMRILMASRLFERATKRWFYPRDMLMQVDGKGGPKLLLAQPIINISAISFETGPFSPSSLDVDLDSIVVYNRHLRQNLLEPDDRNNPKLEMFNPMLHSDSMYRARASRMVFPQGAQNIELQGTFGYTDYDPDEAIVGGFRRGKTPDMVKWAVTLMVVRELEKAARAGARFDAQSRHRLTSERTRDQSYTLEGLGAAARGSSFTGDPEIDNIVAFYQRPPALGAV